MHYNGIDEIGIILPRLTEQIFRDISNDVFLIILAVSITHIYIYNSVNDIFLKVS